MTVQNIRFKIQDGRGYNQLAFHGELKPGVYKLIAYTDWLKNFGQNFFFQRDIRIVSRNEIVKTDNLPAGITFFSEGGHLIQGVENHLVAVGPPATELVISDEGGTEINKIIMNTAGVGTFTLTPADGMKYFGARLGESERWPLPKVEHDGVVIELDHNAPANFKIAIPVGSGLRDKKLYAVLLSQGKILLKEEINMDQGKKFQLDLPARLKSEAYLQLFILDSNGTELAQRVFVQLPDQGVRVKLHVGEALQREDFTFAVNVFDEHNEAVESDMSVSVFQNGLFKHSQPVYDLYMSDIPGVMEWVNANAGQHENYLNDFLISKQWNRIDWKSIVNDKMPAINYPFQSQITIRGQVRSIKNNDPAPDSTHVISFLQGNAMGYDGYTKNGFFEIPLYFDFWDNDDVFYTASFKNRSMDNSHRITIVRDTLDIKSRWTSSEQAEDSKYGGYAIKRNLVKRSYSFFQNQKMAGSQIKSTNQILEDEFQGADQSVNAADFVVFPTMEDFLREVVGFVQIRKRGDERAIQLFYRYENSVTFYKNDPLYVIDGIMSKNTSLFLSINPADIISLKAINHPNKLAQAGELGENGIIFIESKKGDLSKRFNHNIFPITGLSRPVGFKQVIDPSQDAGPRKPDLRSTLYWNPSIKTDGKKSTEITLQTSDDAGPMKIVIQGITSEGKAFISEHVFNVELNSNRK